MSDTRHSGQAFNSSSQQAEAENLKVQDQFELQIKTLKTEGENKVIVKKKIHTMVNKRP